MDQTSTAGDARGWEYDLRAREEEGRAAFLAADIDALQRLWAEDCAVNSPLQQVLRKPQVLALLQAGRIRHSAYQQEIEHIGRHGDVVVVMGHDQVADPPDGAITQRRYTNVWRLENGTWRLIARHANAVSRQAAG